MKRWIAIACLLVFAGRGSAEAPASAKGAVMGSVSGAGPVFLSGVELDVAGVVSWTVFEGDTVGTTSQPAVLTLRNGLRLSLFGNSVVRLENGMATIVKGRADGRCVSPCGWTLAARSRRVALRPGQGVSIQLMGDMPQIALGKEAGGFEMPPKRLTGQLPYSMGIHLPGEPANEVN